MRITTLSRSIGAILASAAPACACAAAAPAARHRQEGARQVVWTIDNLRSIGGHKVTVVGSPTVVDGPAGKAVQFDGRKDALLVDADPIEGMAAFTVEAIFRPDADGPREQRFFHIQETGSEDRLLLELRLTNDKRWFADTYIRSGRTQRPLQVPGATHAAGRWHSLALVFDGREMAHYVDGVKEASASLGLRPHKAGRTSIGMRINEVHWFKGAIRVVRITAAALPPKEFLQAPPAPAEAAEAAGAAFNVPSLRRLTVDGKADDWADAGFRVDVMHNHQGAGQPARADRPRMRLAWTGQGLALLVVLAGERLAAQPAGKAPAKATINVVVNDGADALSRYQVLLDVTAAGVSTAALLDRRCQRFFDPRVEREAFDACAPLKVHAASRRSGPDCAVEVLLPWQNLGLRPRPGDAFALQVMVWGGGAARMAWFPTGWAANNPLAMHRIRLAERPPPPVTELPPAGEEAPPAKASPGVYHHAGLHLYVPPGVRRLRGVYVTLPGSGQRTLVEDVVDPRYTPMIPVGTQRRFVEHAGFALMGADGGASPAKLADGLTALAATSAHPEIAHAPLIVDGFSAGSAATQRILCAMPGRLIAFAALSFMPRPIECPPGALKVPGLLYTGRKDGYGKGYAKGFADARAAGAPWALVVQPDTGHSTGSAAALLFPFYLDVIGRRLPAETPADRPVDLRELDPKDCWLADNAAGTIAPFADTPQAERLRRSYLPSRFTAGLWRAVCTSRHVGLADVQRILREATAPADEAK